ncbi:MAG: NAD-dependent epimerase/dehydratase family protein [bacterium]|nr:NAD-dependent epimerase/dehydratase family protein [bacterium]
MRVFLAGGTGVIGRPLVARLLAGNHDVGVLARSDAAAARVHDMGAEPVLGDGLNEPSLGYAVRTYAPHVVINQLTSLPKSFLNPRAAAHGAKLTNRLRSEATPVLVTAASEAGAYRVISQSISFAQEPGDGVRVEEDPLYVDAPSAHRNVVQAVGALEEATMGSSEVEGVVLRYGAIYGPGSYFADGEAYPSMLARRLLPVIGEGRGVWSLLHVDDAVDATIAAMKCDPGIYNICDDDPVPAAELFPWMALALGAKAPRTASRALFGTGPLTIMRYLFDEQPAVSSQRARDIMHWRPRHPDWRHELARVLRGEPLV